MGTRADFYIKKAEEKELVWVASIAWDGYPDGIDSEVLKSKTEAEFTNNLSKFLSTREDVTLPADGWPWPWDDSRTTDYSYIFMGNKVMASRFGRSLFNPNKPEPHTNDPKLDNFFPDMKDIKNVRYDKGSGIIIISAK